MKQLTKKQLNETVTIICYGRIEHMTRSKAIDKYYEGMLCCDGCESERYQNIYCDLIDGRKVCQDREYEITLTKDGLQCTSQKTSI